MPSLHPNRPFFLAGPTGSGKTALVLTLARHFPVEIVAGDAFQLYRGMATLTACPTQAEREICPHHLFEVLPPSEQCDAGQYLALARPLLAEIAGRGNIPVVTGGSGLYLKALTHGLENSPPVDQSLRASLEALPIEKIRERLSEVDPVSLERIGPHNRRYLQRALEVSLSAHQPASQLRKTWSSDPQGLRGILLERPRQELVARIAARTLAMFEQGAVEEVAAVTSWSSTSLQAIGVREIQALLRGELDRDSCIQLIQQATRRYARRQTTWFRRETWMSRLTPPPGDNWDLLLPECRALLDR